MEMDEVDIAFEDRVSVKEVFVTVFLTELLNKLSKGLLVNLLMEEERLRSKDARD